MSEGHVSTDDMAEQEQSTNQADDGEFIIQDYSNSMVQGESVAVSELGEDDDNGAEGKNYVQLDMVNYTLVRCQENEDTTPEYRLVAALGAGEEGQQNIARVDGILPDGTMYVLDESGVGEGATEEGGGRYVTVVNPGAADAQGTLMIMEYAADEAAEQPVQHEQMQEQSVQEETEEEDTSAALLAQVTMELPHIPTASEKKANMLARKRNALPPPHVLLASPNFKPYLYSCKQCDYKCNSMRELTAHKKEDHAMSGRTYNKSPPPQRASSNPNQKSQCPKCGTKYYSYSLLTEHIRTCKSNAKPVKRKNSEREEPEQEQIDLLQCGLCGFETADKPQFHRHVIKHRKLSGRIVTSSHKPNN